MHSNDVLLYSHCAEDANNSGMPILDFALFVDLSLVRERSVQGKVTNRLYKSIAAMERWRDESRSNWRA